MTDRAGRKDRDDMRKEIAMLKGRVAELSGDREKVIERCQWLEKERDYYKKWVVGLTTRFGKGTEGVAWIEKKPLSGGGVP